MLIKGRKFGLFFTTKKLVMAALISNTTREYAPPIT